MRTWVKLYTEINRDPKIGTLTWAQKGIWSALLALAGEIDAEDESGQRTGALDTVDNIAWRLRCDEAELSEAMDTFAERGMAIEDDAGIWYLPNFANRQARAPSQRRDAVRARVQQHRAKVTFHCNEDVTTLRQAVTPSESDTDTEAEAESEPPVPAMAGIMHCVEEMFGLNAMNAEKATDLADEYGPDALSYALTEAHEHGAPKWAYVRAILENGGKPRAAPSPPLDVSNMAVICPLLDEDS